MRNPVMMGYWGKANSTQDAFVKWHPLVYHMLDVAAVAAAWWDIDSVIQKRFAYAFAEHDVTKIRAWVLFFVALHDLGKADIRFQLKAPSALALAYRDIKEDVDHNVSLKDIRSFDHGLVGMVWSAVEHKAWIKSDQNDIQRWGAWSGYLSAVAGHHGDLIYTPEIRNFCTINADQDIISRDVDARYAIVECMADLFLHPAGLLISDMPPDCSLSARHLLAGFCTVADWLGSNVEEFAYCTDYMPPVDYWRKQYLHASTSGILRKYGLIEDPKAYVGVHALLAHDEYPRGIQTVIDQIPDTTGLIIVEAPTGSGKTEAAVAYAWRLLAEHSADSIVFALPTQATANAMLDRMDVFSESIYGQANVVLAHGKRDFNSSFKRMVQRGNAHTVQGSMEAGSQCAGWLSSSKKRVFLGQIGVCTVDQVLLSVLPVRHKFVRGFGIQKSVLIIDEVHAYDAYMYGLLEKVLEMQSACGGSAVLLSATLPSDMRNRLLAAWGSDTADASVSAPYPVVWCAHDGSTDVITVTADNAPPHRNVHTECLRLDKSYPDVNLLKRMISAAQNGALVGMVVNLVDDAQSITRALRKMIPSDSDIEVDIFHARYRFKDRQDKESAVTEHYGRRASRHVGRILVATQVIEQSLDLDFDWMITQICPVDLLFQRIGRLHRHPRVRPHGFNDPMCTVLTPNNGNYGVFELIYGNKRVLWRTEQMLLQNTVLQFPTAYRTYIERVYQRDDWENEPERISCDFDVFYADQLRRTKDATQLTTMTSGVFRDEDGRITGLTRDGEMGLSVIPMLQGGVLLDGQNIHKMDERECAEQVSLNTVFCPVSWTGLLHSCKMDNEGSLAGILQMVMSDVSDGVWEYDTAHLRYSRDFGMEKTA